MFIGEKEIKLSDKPDIKTVRVTFTDDSVEHFTEIMYEKIVSEESCTLEVLRDKRVQPVVAVLLQVLCEWGIKLSELGYISALLNRSLDYNRDSALKELWSKWMPRPSSPDDVDLLTIDRVLRSKDKHE